MKKLLPVFAMLLAIAVTATAMYELSQRKSDEEALETTPPSPITSPTEAPSPTQLASPSEEATDEPAPAQEDTEPPPPSETEEPAATEAPDTPTPSPLRTPSPEPAEATPNATVDPSQGETAHTGAESWPAGTALALIALVLRGLVLRRRSY